ncbi:substrate-binding domain-containing protein [Vibrio penaeicida]|uniref:substrate-binding domain-containing protein n=1 Tax=Vibrio penaeicida TaxID=104609 RepID=UPI00273779C7|nr:substrate-binding domain-containing protein [Vibrio penaeicida]MDP2573645.1 substrate-binding domain-containing protein [Vibrio penaeicida]
MRKLTTLIALSAALVTSAAWSKPLEIVFTHHSSASNPFWQAVKKGFDDACGKIDAKCQMIFTQTEGAIDQQAGNMIAALAAKPDVLITSIVDNNAFDEIIARARANGTIVMAANVDDLEGASGNARQALLVKVLPLLVTH